MIACVVSDGGKKNDGMRRDELNRMACGWLARGGIAATRYHHNTLRRKT